MTPVPTQPTQPAITGFPHAVDPELIETQLAALSLEQKVGQMLMVGLPSSTLDPDTRRRIVDHAVGGVIFLEHNGTSPQQVQTFTTEMQRAALDEGAGIPLFIAWNHEGGRVVRRSAGMTRFPSAMAIGATGEPQNAYEVGQAVGQEMASLGVNMNYAPVLDVNTAPANPVIGLRAFGDDPALVAEFGRHYIAGQQDAGIIAVGKHFPGHGGVNVDSHISLPRLDATNDAIRQTELPPFQTAVAAKVGAIMVAHLQVPALEASGVPTTFSAATIDELLRKQMGYNGVIMTDDMNMGALNAYSPAEAALQAVLAGNDMLITVNQYDYELFRQALIDAVRDGRIPLSRIDTAVLRILALKQAYDLTALPHGPPLPNQEEHENLAVELGSQAVTLLRDTSDQLPLSLPNNRVLLITPNKLNPGSVDGDGFTLFGEYLQKRDLSVIELIYTHNQPDSLHQVEQQALAQAPQVDVIIFVTWDAIIRYVHYGETTQETVANNLLTSGKPVVVIAGQLPYDRQRLTDVPTLLTLYGDTPGQIYAAVSQLLGP